MSKTFKVGDICIGHSFVHDTFKNGQECRIACRLGWDMVVYKGETISGDWWSVIWNDGDESRVRAQNLRLKKPSCREQDEVVSWESVGWMPMDVKLDRAIKQALKDNVKERA